MNEFVDSFALEEDRSAVVLGGERINSSLKLLLEAYAKISAIPGLCSKRVPKRFKERIEAAQKVDLIDKGFADALHLVRELRNDFAHAAKVETLERDKHARRVKSLAIMAHRWKEGRSSAAHYLDCIIALVLQLELNRYYLISPEVKQCKHCATLTIIPNAE